MNKPVISLILCSRNDSYMGNSRWRFETSINLALENAAKADFLDKLEIIVSDWGSEVPLSDVLNLNPNAKKCVKFLHIPKEIATKEQKDSKFPEVLALNAAARRAQGEFIGRIDNDTIVGKEFFQKFVKLYQEGNPKEVDLFNSFLFVERKSIPYRISRLSLPSNFVSYFIAKFEKFLKLESAEDWGKEFWWSPVGIMIFHQEIWEKSRGYDERLLYWGWMEGDLALRLSQKHELIEFSKFVGFNFFHLEHYSNLTEYKDRNGAATPRKKNPIITENLSYTVNSINWGLYSHDLVLSEYSKKNTDSPNFSIFHSLELLKGCTLIIIDRLVFLFRDFFTSFINTFKIKTGQIRKVLKF